MLKIIIRAHSSSLDEVRWVSIWLFEEVFGLQCEVQAWEQCGYQIELDGEETSLALPDDFLRDARANWLDVSTLPSLPVHYATVESLPGASEQLGRSELPNLFSEIQECLFYIDSQRGVLNLDVIGSLFFLMSRYEEAVIDVRDKHDRFPASASILGKAGLLDRAIGNEYIEVLWAAMTRIWPSLERKKRVFRMLPTHDIDHPSQVWSKWSSCLRSNLGRLRRGHFKSAVRGGFQRVQYALSKDWESDPYDTITWLSDVASEHNSTATFYYIPEQTHPTIDRGMPITHPHVVDQWRRIADAGHEIGVHPGYNTYRSREKLVSGTECIRRQLELLKIDQKEIGGRQHYLRWDSVETASHYVSAGIAHDSSLGYADQPGFRTGLCYEHPMYDVVTRQPLQLRERPLVLMDVSLTNSQYLGLDLGDEAMKIASSLKNECRKYSGDFTVLWHNNYFTCEDDRQFYTDLLGY